MMKWIRSGRTALISEKGMTLYELVISLVITLVVLTLAIFIISLNGQMIQLNYNRSMNRSEALNALRKMRSDIQKLSPDSLIHAQPDQLTFYDIDGNYINYQMSGNTLYKNNQLIVGNLVQEPFDYLNDKLNPVESVQDTICFIKVDVEIQNKGQVQRASEVLYLRN